MLFFTASLWLMLSLLAPRSSGDKIDEPLHLQPILKGDPSLGDVINDLCQLTPKLGRIFAVSSPAGHYKFDFAVAKYECEQQGATLATYHQLYEAWQDGLEHCACGWLSDRTSRYPMQTKKHGCGDAGINKCTWAPNLWDAWCFRTMSICD